MTAVFTFNVAVFRQEYPAFSDAFIYPDASLQSYWDTAICYISDKNYGYLRNDCRDKAINLMTAHLAAISSLIASGQNPSLVNSATIDKISVSLTPPPAKSQYQWWLSVTPYGAQLLALLQIKGAGGFFVGGLPETAALRKVYGVY